MLSLGLKNPLAGGAAALIVFLISLLSVAAGFIIFPIGVFALLMAVSPSKQPGMERRGCSYCITACAGPLAGRQFFLTERSPVLEFGRENCDIQLPWDTKGVGRHHCRLILQNGRPFLEDNDSKYGTYLGSPFKRLTSHIPTELENGTEFWLASNQIAFRINRIN